MLKVTLPVGGAADESTVMSYMEKRGSCRVISNTWNCVLGWAKRKRFRDVEEIAVLKKIIIWQFTHVLFKNFLPNFPSNKSLDVQIYWYVFWGDDGDSDTARQVLGAGVDDVALPLKYPLCKDEHCTDDGFWRREQRHSAMLCIRIYSGFDVLKIRHAELLRHFTVWCWNAEFDMSLLGLCSRSYWQRRLKLSVGWYDTHPTVCLWHTLKQRYSLCGC